MIKQITLYAYDRQLRPGVIGADFETDNPDDAYTLRYEKEDAEVLMRDVYDWIVVQQK